MLQKTINHIRTRVRLLIRAESQVNILAIHVRAHEGFYSMSTIQLVEIADKALSAAMEAVATDLNRIERDNERADRAI